MSLPTTAPPPGLSGFERPAGTPLEKRAAALLRGLRHRDGRTVRVTASGQVELREPVRSPERGRVLGRYGRDCLDALLASGDVAPDGDGAYVAAEGAPPAPAEPAVARPVAERLAVVRKPSAAKGPAEAPASAKPASSKPAAPKPTAPKPAGPPRDVALPAAGEGLTQTELVRALGFGTNAGNARYRRIREACLESGAAAYRDPGNARRGIDFTAGPALAAALAAEGFRAAFAEPETTEPETTEPRDTNPEPTVVEGLVAPLPASDDPAEPSPLAHWLDEESLDEAHRAGVGRDALHVLLVALRAETEARVRAELEAERLRARAAAVAREIEAAKATYAAGPDHSVKSQRDALAALFRTIEPALAA